MSRPAERFTKIIDKSNLVFLNLMFENCDRKFKSLKKFLTFTFKF